LLVEFGASVSRIELYNSDRIVSCLCSLRDAAIVIHFCLLYV
jgi:hypothetical protein